MLNAAYRWCSLCCCSNGGLFAFPPVHIFGHITHRLHFVFVVVLLLLQGVLGKTVVGDGMCTLPTTCEAVLHISILTKLAMVASWQAVIGC